MGDLTIDHRPLGHKARGIGMDLVKTGRGGLRQKGDFACARAGRRCWPAWVITRRPLRARASSTSATSQRCGSQAATQPAVRPEWSNRQTGRTASTRCATFAKVRLYDPPRFLFEGQAVRLIRRRDSLFAQLLAASRVRINALVTMCSGPKVVMWESLIVPAHHCGSSYLAGEMGFL